MLKSRISWDSWQSITKLQGYSTPLFPCPSLIHVIYSEWRWRHDWDSLDSSIFHDNCKLTTFYPSHSLMRPPFPPLVPPPPAVAALRTPSYIALSLCLHFFFFFEERNIKYHLYLGQYSIAEWNTGWGTYCEEVGTAFLVLERIDRILIGVWNNIYILSAKARWP